MPTISGYVNTMAHSVSSPNCAPACEYVAMPDGSSSAAPVIRPGPSCRAQSRIVLFIALLHRRRGEYNPVPTPNAQRSTPIPTFPIEGEGVIGIGGGHR